MKLWKHTLISTLAFIGLSSTVLYTSCTDDACLKLKCRNGGTCADDKCKCPTGYEGSQCESRSADRFYGIYHGTTKINQAPPFIDSVYVRVSQYPNVIKFIRVSRADDVIEGTIGSNGNVTINNDPKFGGRDIVINVENEKLTFTSTEHSDGGLQNIVFVGTLTEKR